MKSSAIDPFFSYSIRIPQHIFRERSGREPVFQHSLSSFLQGFDARLLKSLLVQVIEKRRWFLDVRSEVYLSYCSGRSK